MTSALPELPNADLLVYADCSRLVNVRLALYRLHVHSGQRATIRKSGKHKVRLQLPIGIAATALALLEELMYRITM